MQNAFKHCVRFITVSSPHPRELCKKTKTSLSTADGIINLSHHISRHFDALLLSIVTQFPKIFVDVFDVR